MRIITSTIDDMAGADIYWKSSPFKYTLNITSYVSGTL
jgi:hypothetical protein